MFALSVMAERQKRPCFRQAGIGERSGNCTGLRPRQNVSAPCDRRAPKTPRLRQSGIGIRTENSTGLRPRTNVHGQGCDGTLFFTGWREPYIADPTPDPGQNLIFYRSPVREPHLHKKDPDADPAGEPIFYRLRAPPCKLINPDPCRIHHACHVSDIGSIRIHVADPCRNPSFYMSRRAPRLHLLKF